MHHGTEVLSQVAAQPLVLQAFELIDSMAETITREQVSICEIPAPPFKEECRAQYCLRRFHETGMDQVSRDPVGNVLAVRKGLDCRRSVVISAHMDTIFPSEVNVRVRHHNGRLSAPGISDNACGLAALWALADVLQRTPILTSGTLLFLMTVGEEGEGNLRGVRHFFSESVWAGKVDAFVAFDGHGIERIVHQALGSRRYRVTVTGPGGHSWGDFGNVNPIHPLASVITQLSEYPLPASPRTALNVGRVTGGHSVNAIPQTATFDVDFRSTSVGVMEQLGAFLESTVEIAVKRENIRCSSSDTQLQFTVDLLGERPTGQTPPDSEIVRAAVSASQFFGVHPHLECASTDANIPISLGIPAITIGAGGIAGQPHTLEEWYEATGREVGIKRALLLLLSLVGVAR